MAIVACTGLALIVVGSFLPWARSGDVDRDSFEIAGVIDRLGPGDTPLLSAALTGWIVVPLLCVLSVVLYVLGLIRTSVLFAVIVSAAAGAVGLATYVVGKDGPGLVTAVAAGPLTTFVGGVVALIGSLGAVLGVIRGRSRQAG